MNGQTPLSCAAMDDRLAILELLLQEKAEVTAMAVHVGRIAPEAAV
jgi:ankyrin repeat protein